MAWYVRDPRNPVAADACRAAAILLALAEVRRYEAMIDRAVQALAPVGAVVITPTTTV
jgi:hypothetical protein